MDYLVIHSFSLHVSHQFVLFQNINRIGFISKASKISSDGYWFKDFLNLYSKAFLQIFKSSPRYGIEVSWLKT